MAAAVSAAILGGWTLVRGRDAAFAVADLPDDTAPGSCAVWFIGSSSIHRWTTLGADMRPWTAHNRGVDGATIREVTTRFLHAPPVERPQAIVFYGGDNDIAYGETAAAAIADLRLFLSAEARRMGDLPVFLLSLKPSPARWNLLAEQTAYNAAARSIAAASPTIGFIDIAPRMLRAGRPGPYYVADGTHMNAAGYAIWTDAVRRALARRLPKTIVRACSRTGESQARHQQAG